MHTLIQLLPKTASLRYNISGAHGYPLYLSALGNFKQLTTLELAGPFQTVKDYPFGPPRLNIGCLPPTILSLGLHWVSIVPGSTKYLQCKNVNWFHCEFFEGDWPEYIKLMASLTELEVSLDCRKYTSPLLS